jgi:hypothetical protein
MKKRVFILTLLTCVILISATALAISIADTRQLSATFNNIKIYVDGQLIEPKDALGRPVEPFIVDGSTYLPVRAVSEALGKDVEWDGPNQSVYIGRKPIIPTSLDSGAAQIAIITTGPDYLDNGEAYYSAQEIVKKYGADKVVHLTRSGDWYEKQEEMDNIVASVAAAKTIKALIINQAMPDTIVALDKLSKIRNDVFTVLVNPTDDPPSVVARADLVLSTDEINMGPAMVQQAKKLGAKTFVHLSFPRHMSYDMISERSGLIEENCKKLGLDFVYHTVYDPTGDIGMAGAQQFMLEEIPKLVKEYGKDTAFFCTNCGLQIPLVKAVVDLGAIYPQPCCPSPFHGFPLALGLISETESVFDRFGTENTAAKVVAKTTEILRQKGMLGRLSTWPVPVSMLSTNAAADYAFKWINGEVSQDKLDTKVLQQCLKDYAGVDVYLNTYEYDNWYAGTMVNTAIYDNWLLIREDYITY